MSNGRITEALLTVANVAQRIKGDGPQPEWIHHGKWTIHVNRFNAPVTCAYMGASANIPFGGVAVWNEEKLVGTFNIEEGFLTDSDEFINDMKELLEKAV